MANIDATIASVLEQNPTWSVTAEDLLELSIHHLRPYERAGHPYRQPDPEKVAAMLSSIREVGIQTPLIARCHQGTWSNWFQVLDGRLRLQCARELGLDELPIICVDKLTDDKAEQFVEAQEDEKLLSRIFGLRLDKITAA